MPSAPALIFCCYWAGRAFTAGGDDEAEARKPDMKVAIVHDWLTTYGGAERVLEQLLQLYPQADLFSLIDFLPAEQRRFLGSRKVHTSFLQRLRFAK